MTILNKQQTINIRMAIKGDIPVYNNNVTIILVLIFSNHGPNGI